MGCVRFQRIRSAGDVCVELLGADAGESKGRTTGRVAALLSLARHSRRFAEGGLHTGLLVENLTAVVSS